MKRAALPNLWFSWAVISLVVLIFTDNGCQKSWGPENNGKALTVEVSVDKPRVKAGEKVTIKAIVRSGKTLKNLKTSASLFVPAKGAQDLAFQALEPAGKNEIACEGEVSLALDSPQGLYGINVSAAISRIFEASAGMKIWMWPWRSPGVVRDWGSSIMRKRLPGLRSGRSFLRRRPITGS